jgi:hypothetical protein
MTMWLVVAAAPPEDKVQPGWLGFFVVLGLGVMTYLLWRSMNKQIKRVNFDGRPADGEADKDDKHLGTDAEQDAKRDGTDKNQDKPPDRSNRQDT